MKTEIAVIAIVAALIVGAGAGYWEAQSTLSREPPTSTTTTVCSISGQPGPIFYRILSDSTMTPLVGAQVMATNRPAYCSGSPATKQTTETFITNSTEWYALSSDNNAGYSFVVRYSGQNYTFRADLRPVSATCATLFIPSGKTNIAITEFRITCK